MRAMFPVLLLLAGSASAASSTSVRLSAATLAELSALRPGASTVIGGVPYAPGRSANIRFRRIEVYAPGARIVVIDAGGEHVVPRSRRVELVGSDATGEVRASLAFDAGFTDVTGVGASPDGAFLLRGARAADGSASLRAARPEETLPAGVMPDIVSGDDALPSGRAEPGSLAIALSAATTAAAARAAIVAIDTDNEFMSLRFANNTTAATNWIADLFGAMNVMYNVDLDIGLQQGTTTLRTTTDPYIKTVTPADDTDLDEFGEYWQGHYGSVPRTFAALLSGKSGNGNSASGIAWVNAYCQTQSQGGSYSVDQIFTNAQIDVSYSALIVAHELGHNFGASHTHCTNVTNGSAPVASNTIDQCFSGESGCYSGTTSCPSNGPGAPAGTIMSYCNTRQCGPNGQNLLAFHPTQISVLHALIASQPGSCLGTPTDLVFGNGFD